MGKLVNIVFCSFFIYSSFFSQSKDLSIHRISEKIKVDGILDERAWQSDDFATDFIEFQPNNGAVEKTNSPTQVRMLYDDTAIYFGFTMEESKMDSLNTRLSNRDDISDSEDWVLILLNPYNDKQQFFQFGVSAAGVQFDATNNLGSGEDWSWNAIWNSAVHIEEDKWFVEIALPYSAIRFPKEYDKKWSVNFARNYSKNRKKFAWQRIDNDVGNLFQYVGEVGDFEGIQPPTRLFFIPYISDYVTNLDGKTLNSFRGGMDLNWGINESYTLDAILIPDFGQTGFDAVEYVLGPFEQQFSDQRPFFTEGTDLFNKGSLLYSRRIGQSPSYEPPLGADEEITEYPKDTRLLNALKISGRSKNGLGIGVLNAITANEYATIYNDSTMQTRKALVNPLSNYNELVFDKRLKESSSSFSLVNTNVTRDGSFRDANATALVADLYDKENKYNYFARARFSYISDAEHKTGTNLRGSWSKQFGKYRYNFGGSYTSKYFDINDMGINFYTNYWDLYVNGSYRILESTDKFNSLNINNGIESRFDNTTGKPYYAQYYFNFNSNNKKNNYNGFGVSFDLAQSYDFYDPRVEGRYSKNAKWFNFWYYNSPNYGKKFLIDKNIWGGLGSFKDMYNFGFDISPRYRPSDNLLLQMSFSWDWENNDRGYVAQSNNDIIYGDRDRKTMTINLNGEYYFNPVTSLSLNFRHYYTNADYQRFWDLNQDGSYHRDVNFNENPNFTYNNWNMDLRFSWWFAPGSQMEILYRNTLDSYLEIAENNLGQNYKNLFDNPLTQIFSVRITYFLDYNKAKAFFKGKRNTVPTDQNASIDHLIEMNQAKSKKQNGFSAPQF